MYTLHIANKNYSSWSLRPWVLMRALNISFEGVLHKFGEEDFKTFSPAATVPCLYDEESQEKIILWDSLAIIEYLSEEHKNIYPESKTARAWSRSACAEMHSGFSGIRNVCSMSCGVRVTLHKETPELLKDIARLDTLWSEGINKFGGPYLAGKEFSAADAMYSPVVFRVQTYGLKLSDISQAYIKTMLAHPAMKEWYEAALNENFREKAHEEWTRNTGTTEKDFRIKEK
ncbi:MAG: glutathione S-transferase [Cellvibrionaceae bacterium]